MDELLSDEGCWDETLIRTGEHRQQKHFGSCNGKKTVLAVCLHLDSGLGRGQELRFAERKSHASSRVGKGGREEQGRSCVLLSSLSGFSSSIIAHNVLRDGWPSAVFQGKVLYLCCFSYF